MLKQRAQKTDEHSLITFRKVLGRQIVCVHEQVHAADLFRELYDNDKGL